MDGSLVENPPTMEGGWPSLVTMGPMVDDAIFVTARGSLFVTEIWGVVYHNEREPGWGNARDSGTDNNVVREGFTGVKRVIS